MAAEHESALKRLLSKLKLRRREPEPEPVIEPTILPLGTLMRKTRYF
jgi:hypothetical protein